MQFDISATSSAASLTGFASNVTGATWTLTATEVGDGLAHLATIRNDSATDHSGKTITLAGTAPDGQPQTETLAGPAGAATVTSTRYYLTLTSVTVDATIGADTFDIGWAAASVSPSTFLNVHGKWDGAGFGCAVTSGTPTYGVQVAYGGYWFDHATVTNETTSQYGEIAQPAQAVRLVFTAAGGVSLTGVQAGA